ncbi:MAG: Trm112 family protein [Chloroflexota bacterium]|nr:Trm112 family protein [Chloroflexota bacterium]
MVNQDLLDILRCPACVRNGPEAGLLDLVKEMWLVCQDCQRKYPIRDDIPVMLIEEGDKYENVPVEELGTP